MAPRPDQLVVMDFDCSFSPDQAVDSGAILEPLLSAKSLEEVAEGWSGSSTPPCHGKTQCPERVKGTTSEAPAGCRRRRDESRVWSSFGVVGTKGR